VPEELDGEPVRGAFVQKLFNHFGGELLVKVELERIVDHHCNLGDELRDGHVVANTLFESSGKLVIPAVVLFDTLVEGIDLGKDDGSGKVAHSDRVVGKGNGVVLEVLLARNGHVLRRERLVGTGVNGGLGGDIRIVGKQEPPFSGVDHLVRLTADSASNTHMSRVLVAVPDAQ